MSAEISEYVFIKHYYHNIEKIRRSINILQFRNTIIKNLKIDIFKQKIDVRIMPVFQEYCKKEIKKKESIIESIKNRYKIRWRTNSIGDLLFNVRVGICPICDIYTDDMAVIPPCGMILCTDCAHHYIALKCLCVFCNCAHSEYVNKIIELNPSREGFICAHKNYFENNQSKTIKLFFELKTLQNEQNLFYGLADIRKLAKLRYTIFIYQMSNNNFVGNFEQAIAHLQDISWQFYNSILTYNYFLIINTQQLSILQQKYRLHSVEDLKMNLEYILMYRNHNMTIQKFI